MLFPLLFFFLVHVYDQPLHLDDLEAVLLRSGFGRCIYMLDLKVERFLCQFAVIIFFVFPFILEYELIASIQSEFLERLLPHRIVLLTIIPLGTPFHFVSDLMQIH